MNTDETPSTHGRNGHDAAGRFKRGNRLGKGNPLAGRAAKIRAVLLKSVTAADAKEITAKLVEMAKGGDLAAIRELLDRTIGKPAATEILERVEILEQRMNNRHNGVNHE